METIDRNGDYRQERSPSTGTDTIDRNGDYRQERRPSKR
ncbi:hypothetical protein chiPu_0022899, partial [Chiloscyllium punctatum]|nr:hypothetical protein [Chiloscyllium punctatum]